MVDSDARAASSAPEMEGQESRLAYRTAKDKLQDAPQQADEQLNPINPKSRKRNRCYLKNGEYLLLPRCPERARCSTSACPHSSLGTTPQWPPISSISLEERLSVDREPTRGENAELLDTGSFSAPAALPDGFAPSPGRSELVLDTGATAHVACFKLLWNLKRLQEQHGYPAAVS